MATGTAAPGFISRTMSGAVFGAISSATWVIRRQISVVVGAANVEGDREILKRAEQGCTDSTRPRKAQIDIIMEDFTSNVNTSR
jgi:hypothetical protein